MADALEQFAQETIKELLSEMPPEKRIEGLSVEQLLAAMRPETRAAMEEHFKRTSLPETNDPKPADPKP